MEKRENHFIYYLLLVGVLLSGLLLILAFSPNRNLQMLALVGLSLSYILIGITHHFINHDLVLKIVVEYILIASLGIAAAFFIFKGGIGV